MKATLPARWTALLGRIDALNRRERLMVLAAALVLVGFVGDTLLLAPQRMQRLQVERDGARERAELDRIDAQLAELKRTLASDPDEVPKLRLKQLDAELSELNAGFQRLERSLVAPDQMARLLEQVMQRTPGISVVRLQTLAPKSLPEREGERDAEGPAVASPAGAGQSASGQPAAAAAAGATGATTATAGGASPAVATPGQPALWRHGVELTVRGSYADLLRYLDAVERLPVRVYFGRAVLDASQYPDVDLRLTVFTLGMDRSWLAL